jgi:hypothetical protein
MAIPTVEEAAEKLEEILGRIRQGLSAQERSGISDELVSFANPASEYHVPSRPAYAELRETALAVSDEVDKGLSKAALERIRKRTAALARYVTAVSAVTEEAESRVKALKLDVMKVVLSSSKTIVDTVKEAKKAFKEDRTDAGYAAIEKVIDELEGLGTKLPV